MRNLEQEAKKLLIARLDDCLLDHAAAICADGRPAIKDVYELQDLSALHYYLKAEHEFTPAEVEALLEFKDPLNVARWCSEDNTHAHSFPICELLNEINAYERFELLPKERITIQIAECIYTGMVHDTGVFQYSCTSKKTMDIAGSLMEMGIDYSRIIDDTFYTKTFAQNKIMGQALLNAALYLNGDVILSAVSRAEMEKYDVLPKHLDGIVNQLRVTKDIKVAVFLYENEDGTYKGSLRVNGDYDVAKVASVFGGGGHVKAAGFTIDGPLEVATERILTAIKDNI